MDNITFTNEMVGKLAKKGKVAADIAVSSAMKQVSNQQTLNMAIGIGLIQGLKYNGNFKRGIKAGLATMGVFAGANAVKNVAENWDYIKKQ